MSIFKSKAQKDLELGKKFQKVYKKMIIARDKKSGQLVILLRSKNEAHLTIKTSQKELQVVESKKGGNE